jgi:hypothetical protein
MRTGPQDTPEVAALLGDDRYPHLVHVDAS